MLADREETLRVVTVQGQRRRYRFEADLGAIGVLPARPGDLVAVCAEDSGDTYHLSGGPIDQVLTAVTLSRPPRIGEVAALAPAYVHEMGIVADATEHALRRLSADRRYLVNAQVVAPDGALWKMDRYWLEVPPGTRGANLVTPNKRLWFVVEKPRFVDASGGPRLVVRADAVVDELFP